MMGLLFLQEEGSELSLCCVKRRQLPASRRRDLPGAELARA